MQCPIGRVPSLARAATSVLRSVFGLQHLRAASHEAYDLQKTSLYDLHVDKGGKMVPFGGYSMPLSYSDSSPVAEHNHTREAASLFDVSHMVQSIIHGKGATAFLQHLTPSSVSALTYDPSYASTLSVLLNEKGGIIDDCMITRQAEDQYYVVTNAGRRDRDIEWIRRQVDEWNADHDQTVAFEVLEEHALVALQGPQAATVLQPFFERSLGLSNLHFGRAAHVQYGGEDFHVARGGYTGEDGFEISVPQKRAVAFVEELLGHPPTRLAGLAARDSLRLEAGLCLYGVDLDEETSPIEAALAWLVGKDRRQPDAFIGSKTVLQHLKEGPPRRRVGMVVEKSPARHGAHVYAGNGEEKIGHVTSGIPSPSTKQNIAMGYVKNGSHKAGTPLQVEVRGSKRPAQVVKMPFQSTKYFK